MNPRKLAPGLALAAILCALYACDRGPAATAAAPPAAAASCSPARFAIVSHSARIEHDRLIIAAEMRNDNAIPCGVELSTAIKATDGHIVANNTGWPASVSDLAPGATRSFEVLFSEAATREASEGSSEFQFTQARQWGQR